MRYAILPVVVVEEATGGDVEKMADELRRALMPILAAKPLDVKLEAVLIVPIDTGAFVSNILGLAARSIIERQVEGVRPQGLAAARGRRPKAE